MKRLSERNPIVVAIVGLLLLAAIALLAFNAANLPIIGGGTGDTAYFAADAGLAAGKGGGVGGGPRGPLDGIARGGETGRGGLQGEEGRGGCGTKPPQQSRSSPCSATSSWRWTHRAPGRRTRGSQSRCPGPPPPTT